MVDGRLEQPRPAEPFAQPRGERDDPRPGVRARVAQAPRAADGVGRPAARGRCGRAAPRRLAALARYARVPRDAPLPGVGGIATGALGAAQARAPGAGAARRRNGVGAALRAAPATNAASRGARAPRWRPFLWPAVALAFFAL